MIKNYFLSIAKKTFAILLLLTIGYVSGSTIMAQSVPSLHYTFSPESVSNDTVILDQSANGYNGILKNEAIVMFDATLNMNVLDLGMFNGYLDMKADVGSLINTLGDFTISTYFNAGEGANLSANGNMLWTFSNSTDIATDANGSMFWHAKGSNRYAISPDKWTGENGASTGTPTVKNEWHHVAVTQVGDLVTVYYDGIESGTSIVTMKPSDLGATPFNFIGRPCYGSDVFMLDTRVGDFRVYNSGLSAAEILTLAAEVIPDDYPLSILAEKEALDLGDLSNVTSNLVLPLAGTVDSEIEISWTSTNRTIIDSAGVVNRPSDLDGTVILTATLSKNGYSVTKPFTAIVPATGGFDEPLIAHWLFEDEWVDGTAVTDAAEKHYVGEMMDGAKVRKIGTPETYEFSTLDLGSDNGYFDMGTEIGKLIYGLADFTVSTYFFVDTSYIQLGNYGNFLWNFSNSDDIVADQNGNMSLNLRLIDYFISSKYYASGQQSISAGFEPSKGEWHHIAYVQEGPIGTIYVDGEVAISGTISNLPSTTLVQDGRTGTLYNWIGRACYASDVFLRNTLIYDFRMYNIPVSADDIYYALYNEGITKDELTEAYAANPDPNFPAELLSARESLDLGDISALTSDITLPELMDGDVLVEWASSNAFIIDVFGTVVQPENLDGTVILTATLTKNGYKVTKQFTATVKASGGFTSSLILNYNFADEWVTDQLVKDAAELHHEGTLEHGAVIETIGKDDNQFNVLNLYADSSYFDMGEDAGKLIYALNDYTTSIYFYIDSSYTEQQLGANGNFLYAFSNSDSSETHRNGYMFGRASVEIHCVAVKYWADGNVSTANSAAQPTRGEWHHMVFTQDGTVGTVYVDGDTVSSVPFANIPSMALPKEGLLGTKYNFLGRPNFSGDSYLGDSYLYDFRLYNEALTPAEIDELNLKVAKLNTAIGSPVPLEKVKVTDYFRINTSTPGLIQIHGLNGSEKVSVYELTGRMLSVKNTNTIPARRGIYIVRVDNSVSKVLVR